MGNTRGDATRMRLILVAERLFAERGLESVTLAEIGEVAEQRNTRVVNYHFGDRRGLLLAILKLRTTQTAERRLELCDKVLATTTAGTPERLRGLVEAYTVALAEQRHVGNYLGLVSRLETDYGRWDGYMAEFNPSWKAFVELLRAELPHLSQRAFAQRLEAVSILQTHMLATRERRERDGRPAKPAVYAEWLADVIDIELGVFLVTPSD